MQTPPDPRPRPPLAAYLFERRLSTREAAKLIGCSHEQLRCATLPFDDPAWKPASIKLRQKVNSWTRGAIGLGDWMAQQVAA
jgi:hypothetical protein